MRLLPGRQAVVVCAGRCMLAMLPFAEALLAVEHQEVHAERIERSDEHPRQNRKIGKSCTRQAGHARPLR